MNQSADLVIETYNLTKKYEDFIAVDKLNLLIEGGKIFGLLGPNGAGKTTLILMLLGLTEHTSGSCHVCGFDPIREPLKVKRLSGYLQEKVGFYENITAKQNLNYLAQLNRIPEREASEGIDEALSIVGLGEHVDKKVSKFSRGMKQRLAIAGVFFKKPRVAFLDEPTQGIDPKGVSEMLDLFTYMNKEEGTTILLSSHLIHQVQQICDEVGIIVSGKVVFQGTVKDLDWDAGQNWVIEIEARGITKQIMEEISNILGVSSIERSGDILVAECDTDLRSVISAAIVKGGGSLLRLRLKELSPAELYRRYSEVA